MKKFVFAAAALAALTFTSCKKDDDKNPGGGGSVPPPSKLLKKVTQVEDGVTTIYTLTYDANKRLTAYKSNDNTEQVLFTYDNDGNITKVEQQDAEFKNIYTYSYTAGVPVTGTLKSWQKHAGEPDELIEDDILTYTVANQQVTNIHLNMTMDGEEADFKMSYTNGNLSKVEIPGSDLYTATFVYGTRRSPFPQLSKYVLDQAGFSLQFSAKNELLSATYDFPNTTLDKTITNTYTYDADGYALTSNDGETQLKFEYQ
ncbi:MAG TPA: hypothetical protein VHK91_15275 [Flavisolibacter sp.]|jgi:hypothetical protein|nr:hypothetical protein [Flavisolibacter sp.]